MPLPRLFGEREGRCCGPVDKVAQAAVTAPLRSVSIRQHDTVVAVSGAVTLVATPGVSPAEAGSTPG